MAERIPKQKYCYRNGDNKGDNEQANNKANNIIFAHRYLANITLTLMVGELASRTLMSLVRPSF
jgi:hypothetical protein